MNRQRVVVAMSGGVDSSVAAALLKEAGYEAIGVSMRLWCDQKMAGTSPRRPCCSVEDIQDAQRVAGVLSIPFYVLNLEKEFQQCVVDVFWEEYSRGRTPNPCILCNQHIKFGYLLQKAVALGADYLATGHYARVELGENGYRLLKGVDPWKDQSYVLYTLGQEELRRLLLPLGGFHKHEVRQMAARRGLPVARKPDSQEVCFLRSKSRRDSPALSVRGRPGDIVDTGGRILGEHPGIAFFTIGQRKGLGIALGKRAYVVGLDPVSNRVVVGEEKELMSQALVAAASRWVGGEPPRCFPCPGEAKIRYKAPEAPATLFPQGEKTSVRFHRPQRAVAPGQAVVFYQRDVVLGGGIIEASRSSFCE